MKMLSTAIVLVGIGSLHAQTQIPAVHRSALTIEQVTHSLTKAFADRGIQITQEQVSLPSSVLVSGEEPVLEVKSIEPLGRVSTLQSGEVGSAVKMTCIQPSRCLPFYVIVAVPAGTDLRGTSARALQNNTVAYKKTATDVVIKVNAPATLIMDDSVAHLRLSVIALQSGSVGQKIRVSSPDHKQNYLAEVLSANMLKGAF